jgi:hypothetical protein
MIVYNLLMELILLSKMVVKFQKLYYLKLVEMQLFLHLLKLIMNIILLDNNEIKIININIKLMYKIFLFLKFNFIHNLVFLRVHCILNKQNIKIEINV